jgi:hypothetical protein
MLTRKLAYILQLNQMKRVFYYSGERLLMLVFDTCSGYEKVCAIYYLQIVYLQ